jgi:hypothetical protein
MTQRYFVIEDVADPAEVASFHAMLDAARANRDWLAGQWPRLLPGARGKYLAVAGREAFLAETADEARARARAAHPEDKGLFVQFVPAQRGPKVYAHQG